MAARVFEKELTLAELMQAIPDEAAEADSIRLAETFINSWVREQVVLTHAERNLTEVQKDFSAQIENYRKSLLIYAYENELIRQKLDTAVSDAEIAAYYEENTDNFQLKDYIVRVSFSVVDAGSPEKELKKFRKTFYSDEPGRNDELESQCQQLNAACFTNDTLWLYFNDMLADIPLEVYNTEAFLKKYREIEFEKEGRIYLLAIRDYKLKDSVSPLSFEKDNIRNIILNRRKTELLTKMRNDLFNDAFRKKDVEIYTP